jgi:hypothetical protein
LIASANQASNRANGSAAPEKSGAAPLSLVYGPVVKMLISSTLAARQDALER